MARSRSPVTPIFEGKNRTDLPGHSHTRTRRARLCGCAGIDPRKYQAAKPTRSLHLLCQGRHVPHHQLRLGPLAQVSVGPSIAKAQARATFELTLFVNSVSVSLPLTNVDSELLDRQGQQHLCSSICWWRITSDVRNSWHHCTSGSVDFSRS